MCLDEIKTWTEIFANLATIIGIIVGIVGGILAFRQWRLTKTQLQLQRYEKLYPIYEVNINFINAVLGMHCSNQLLSEYARDVISQGFLFSPEIRAMFGELYSQANRLLVCESKLKHTSDANFQQNRAKILEWFNLQTDNIKKLFSPYLEVKG